MPSKFDWDTKIFHWASVEREIVGIRDDLGLCLVFSTILRKKASISELDDSQEST